MGQHPSWITVPRPRDALYHSYSEFPTLSIPYTVCLICTAEHKTNSWFQDTAGDQWFGLPKTDLTPEMKRNWQLLRMRNLLDPKQQKKPLRASVPKYSHLGEIISNPQDPHTAKITRKERKRTFLEEVMNNHSQSKLRHRYAGIQKEKTSGKKASYQKFMAQRKKRN